MHPPHPQRAARRILHRWRCVEHDVLWRVVREHLAEVSPEQLSELSELGEVLDVQERSAWAAARYPIESAADAASAALWASLMSAAPWESRRALEERLLPEVTRVFYGVMEVRNLPNEVRERVVTDLRDGFFYALLIAEEGVFHGWRDVTLRCLEASGDAGPIAALAARLTPDDWAKVSQCFSRRGHWAGTLKAVWPERPTPPSRAEALRLRCVEQPGFLEGLMDLHVLLRLLAYWRQPTPGSRERASSLSVIRQNRGRVRGRLRAVLAERGQGLLEDVLALDGLAARTSAAARRFAWVWAWQELRFDFPMTTASRVLPRCHAPESSLPPFEAQVEPQLRTWVLLVLLRGRLPQLQTWVARGGAAHRDAVWERLLTDGLPRALRDEPTTARSTYHRLRNALSGALPDLLAGLTGTLEAIEVLVPGRGLKARMVALLEPGWAAEVPFPERGFSQILHNIGFALDGMDPAEEAECVIPS